ncbi:MAG: gluconate 2-dehydrogenase subunit 3 family protein [Deltaproteobacteria bacterium]|nr:gluconate 2-dehydrogenase subunit 3 family protein [Deltaproteobacteria bacterium]
MLDARDVWRWSLSRRRFLQGAAAASSLLVVPRAARLARALDAPAPVGFLSAEEYAVVEAITARIVSSDDGSAGARECGVADYVQALLSAFPGADVNGDGRVGAADLTAVARAAGSDDGAADVTGDGSVDDADRALVAASIFGSVLLGEAAFDGKPIFAGGPFSDRNPFPDSATGMPSTTFPANAFRIPEPLTRLQRLAWTVRLLGADAVPEVRDNPLATSLPDVDLRARYRQGLAAVNGFSQTDFGASYDALTSAQQDTILAKVKRQRRAFYELLVGHTIEGMLSAPEYGGNRDRAGWDLIGFGGDSQPLGYTIYDASIDDYRERPDKPNSTIDPDDPCSGFSDEMADFLRIILVRLAGATEFPEPFCFSGE